MGKLLNSGYYGIYFTGWRSSGGRKKNAFWCFLNGSFNPNGICFTQNVGTQSILFNACGNVVGTGQRSAQETHVAFRRSEKQENLDLQWINKCITQKPAKKDIDAKHCLQNVVLLYSRGLKEFNSASLHEWLLHGWRCTENCCSDRKEGKIFEMK